MHRECSQLLDVVVLKFCKYYTMQAWHKIYTYDHDIYVWKP